jgi:aldehyde decarbonylase
MTILFSLQAKGLNGSGELYLQKHPNLKVKIVDGSSLAAALVIRSIPKEVDQVLLTGHLSKVACTIATSLCQMGIKVKSLI